MDVSSPGGIQSPGLFYNKSVFFICAPLLPELDICVLGSRVDVQLKKRKVGVAIVGLLVALLLDVVLEDRGGLWVVSVQSVEDGLDVLWALWRVVE